MCSRVFSLFQQRLDEVKLLVEKTNKSSVLVIQQFPIEEDEITLIPNVRESTSNIISFIELGDLHVLKEILAIADGCFDCILLDADIKTSRSCKIVEFVQDEVKQSRLLHYSDNNCWADTGLNLILQIEEGLWNKNILICGEGRLRNILHYKLLAYAPKSIYVYGGVEGLDGASFISKPEDASEIGLVIGANVKRTSLKTAAGIPNGVNVYDVGIGNFEGDLLGQLNEKMCTVYRVDIRAGISKEVLGVFETNYLIHQVMGEVTLSGVQIIAGGVMGRNGAVVVDHIKNPSHIIGVADGNGNLKQEVDDPSDLKNVAFVKRLISKNT